MSNKRLGRYIYSPRFEALEDRVVLDAQIGAVTMPYDGYLSAAVYDTNGQLVRTLHERAAYDSGVSVPLIWDGKNDNGTTILHDGTYTWKALTSQVEILDQGGYGDSLFSTTVTTVDGQVPGASYAMLNVAVDSSGNFYQVSLPTEGGDSLQSFNSDGLLQRRYNAHGLGVATDNTYLYYTTRSNNIDYLVKLNAATGAPVTFTSLGQSSILINNDNPTGFDPRPPGQWRYTPDQWRQQFSVWGMAVDTHRIWVSDYRHDRVLVYDKTTGAQLATFTVNNPLGIAIESSGASAGAIWVANNGDRVSRFTYTVSGSYSISEDIPKRISGLGDPGGITIGGPNNHLFVALTGDDQIREYDISSTPALAGLGIFGAQQIGGALENDEFNFVYVAGIAVDSSGILNVVEDHRLQRFYTVTGGGHTAGDFKQSIHGMLAEAFPIDTFNYTPDGKFYSFDGTDVFEVDPEYTGGPREGWLGDGSWRIVQRDVPPNPIEENWPRVRRVLMDGATPHEFHYLLGPNNFDVMAVDPSTGALRHSASLGGYWYGHNFLNNPQPGGRWNWTDTDGDGQMEESEITRLIPIDQQSGMGFGTVTENGDIYTSLDKNIVKIPLEGFDAQHNPIYNLANAVVIVPYDGFFSPGHVKVAGNGDIYANGVTPYHVGHGSYLIPGGDWVARYDSSGNQLLLRTTPDSNMPAIALDETDTSGDFYYTAHSGWDEFWIYMMTNDGLVVGRASPGAATAYTMGWIDQQWGVGAFTHPYTGKTYLLGSDVYFGKAERFRVDNIGSIERFEGDDFNWTAPVETTSRWTFDDNLKDSIGLNDGTFYNGATPSAPTYAFGQQGKAIDFDGVDDRVEMPATNLTTAYTVSMWVKPTDVSDVGIWAHGVPSQPFSAGQNHLGLDQSGHFVHYTWTTPAAIDRVTSTIAAQPNTWYHIAAVAETNGLMRLYVNGQEEGTAVSIGNLQAFGTHLLGRGLVEATGFFDGLIDDIRVFEQSLTLADIQKLYAETAAEHDGYWKLDGNLNDSAGTNNGTFVGGVSPNYQTAMFSSGINFDGVDDYASLPYATDPVSYTIAAWVKPTDTTSVGILTRTSASGPLTDFFDQLRINSAGQFEHYTVDANGGHTVTGTTVAQAGLWYHVVGTATAGGLMRLYVNGVEEGQAQLIGTPSAAGDQFRVGSNSGGGMGYFTGLIDDVRVYNEVTSELDIADLFDRGDVLDINAQFLFENNVNDATGAHNGTFNGGTAIYAAGKTGNALDLDGSNDYVDIPYTTDPTGYTIMGWIKPTDVHFANVFTRTNASGPLVNVSDQLRITPNLTLGGDPIPDEGLFEHFTRSDGGNSTVTGTTIVRPDTWYHVAIVATNNGLMQLYVNGQEEGTATIIGQLLTDGDRFQVGRSTLGGFGFYDGLIDELRIYERALSPLEIDSVIRGKSAADITYILPSVSVKATDPNASEQGQATGQYTISRENSLGSLTVNYAMSGSAGNGSDYSTLSGSVVIPDGQKSVTVMLTPIDDPNSEGNEFAVLTISPSANYTVGLPASAQITIADNELAGGDPGWTGSNNTVSGNNYGWSPSTNEANGAAVGEIGGTFSRVQVDSYFGDTNLSQLFTLNDTLTASGKFDALNLTSGWAGSGDSGLFIGFFSQGSSQEVMGLEFKEPPGGTSSVRVRGRMYRPIGGGADTTLIEVPTNGNHTFSFTYDPNLGADGRLTITIGATTVFRDLTDGERGSGAIFDAFGMSVVPALNSENAPAKTAQVFMDDVTYTGGPTGSVLPTVTVSASDPVATEQGTTTAAYTFTRTDTSGNLVVNYTVSGTATSGSDYSALAGSITIPSGQFSATVTLTPIDDPSAEPDETVVVSISPSANYNRGVQRVALATIVDNEPTISVTATDAVAAENSSNTGTYTITRNGTVGNLTVNYTMSGTASSGADYSALSGSVVIPNGQTSVTVTLPTLNDATQEGTETATLEVAATANYLASATNRGTVKILDDDVPGDPGWTGSNNTALGNNYGWSDATKNAGGIRGEIGGVLTRAQGTSFFADTHLSSTPNLNNVISGSGKLNLSNISLGFPTSGLSSIYVGHFSQTTGSKDFLGFEIREHREDAVRVTVRFSEPGGGGSTGNFLILPMGESLNFSYTYDPNLGSNGRLTFTVDGRSLSIDLTSGDRASGATFNAFGITVETNQNSETHSSKSVEVYLDNLSYTGLQAPAAQTVTIAATDGSAAEAGSDPGTFTVTRTGSTVGNLMVNYFITGSAANTTDYGSLVGSVVIPDGQSSALVTVTPVDDASSEGSETVTLTLATHVNYTVGGANSGNVTITDNDGAPAASVADRQIFYNNSAWDGNAAGAGTSDDGAIAPDKSALRANPGQTITATFANYTSFSKGINGIMVDIQGLPGGGASTISASDFVFKTGNNNTPSGWATAPSPASVTVRAGAGTGGSDRVTLIWTDWSPTLNPANEAVAKAWLQVTVLANATTGLSASDVFWFGNAVGENGGVGGTNTVPGVATVTPSDELHARANPKSLLNPALKDNVDDFDRNKQVNPADQLIARANVTSGLNGLKLLAVTNPSAAPVPGFAPASAPAASGATAGLTSSADVLADTSTTDAGLTFALTASPGATTGLSGSARSPFDNDTAWQASSATPAQAPRPALPVLAASPQQIRQAIRDALRELHGNAKDTVEDDLLELLTHRP